MLLSDVMLLWGVMKGCYKWVLLRVTYSPSASSPPFKVKVTPDLTGVPDGELGHLPTMPGGLGPPVGDKTVLRHHVEGFRAQIIAPPPPTEISEIR